MDKDMKKKIRGICLGILLMCSLCIQNVDVHATQIASAESAVIDIETYEVVEGTLSAGGQISLKLRVKNNSDVSDAYNTVVTFESANGALAPVYGDDNQIFIGTVPAGQTIDVVVDAVVHSQYKADAAQMRCYFNYVSGVVALSNAVVINIPTNVSGNLTVEAINVAENATVGVNSLVSIRCKNNGTYAITDAKLLITGAVEEESKEIALPIIGAGKTLAEDFYVRFAEAGVQDIQIEIQYEDSKENACIIEGGNHKVKVTSNIEDTGYDAVVEQVEGVGSMLKKLILLGAAALMIMGVTLSYFKNRR